MSSKTNITVKRLSRIVRFNGGTERQYSTRRFGSGGLSAQSHRIERYVTSATLKVNKKSSRAPTIAERPVGHCLSTLCARATSIESKGSVITLASSLGGSSITVGKNTMSSYRSLGDAGRS